VNEQRTDAVDIIAEQWSRERPDLDNESMAILGRLGRLMTVGTAKVDSVFTAHGLQRGEFDVLATLRRSGEPYELSPSALADTLMMSRAGMTSRLDRLERAGLVRRTADSGDRRSIRIAFTDRGRRLIDIVVSEHFENETQILSALSPADRKTLDRIVRLLLAHLEED